MNSILTNYLYYIEISDKYINEIYYILKKIYNPNIEKDKQTIINILNNINKYKYDLNFTLYDNNIKNIFYKWFKLLEKWKKNNNYDILSESIISYILKNKEYSKIENYHIYNKKNLIKIIKYNKYDNLLFI